MVTGRACLAGMTKALGVITAAIAGSLAVLTSISDDSKCCESSSFFSMSAFLLDVQR